MPEGLQYFALYVEGFQELSTCRVNGMGVGPIPFTAIVEYARIYGIEGYEFEDFHYLIRQMDLEYIRLCEKRSKADMKGAKSGGKQASKRNNN